MKFNTQITDCEDLIEEYDFYNGKIVNGIVHPDIIYVPSGKKFDLSEYVNIKKKSRLQERMEQLLKEEAEKFKNKFK